ncbi:MAG: AraC family transcriptional regulator [Alteraurantiacibacter sp.]
MNVHNANRLGRITDVALECGFNDLSYFSRTFRRRFGVSARVYRLGQADSVGHAPHYLPGKTTAR